jgi:hypothetical protein
MLSYGAIFAWVRVVSLVFVVFGGIPTVCPRMFSSRGFRSAVPTHRGKWTERSGLEAAGWFDFGNDRLASCTVSPLQPLQRKVDQTNSKSEF